MDTAKHGRGKMSSAVSSSGLAKWTGRDNAPKLQIKSVLMSMTWQVNSKIALHHSAAQWNRFSSHGLKLRYSQSCLQSRKQARTLWDLFIMFSYLES
mmetsp:Transcript_4520/g.7111  ORF Transcript_4520/g.7111 Transcript_4520/m.7111 type:complete len:97 (+) Transcript_4520:1076-1366(+)